MSAHDMILRIDRIRKKKGIEAKELAEKAGISYGTYMHWVEGVQNPSLSAFILVAHALGLKVGLCYE